MTVTPQPQSCLSVPGATVDFPDRKAPPMPTTTTSPYPDVPLPAGAIADDNANDWASWDNECRVFRGADRFVLNGAAEVIAEVRTCGLQYPDGSIDNSEEPPSIDINMYIGDDLTSAQARKLALVLLEAADQVDGWVAK
jgi:hypothetical protein